MGKKKFDVVIAGAGGIGRAVGLLLAEYADFDVRLYVGDKDINIAVDAARFIEEGVSELATVTPFCFSPGYEDSPNNHFIEADILLDCLPGTEAPRLGAIAINYGLHYINLTEYVNETNQLIEMAKDAQTGFVLQSGLAPGFVNILANSLYKRFADQYQKSEVEYIGMKVGALTENAEPPYFYGFTWSPVGVATEYLKEAFIIEDFEKSSVPSLSDLNRIIINGTEYEENFTSGGAADLPDAFNGMARKLDYKTLRYPGHYEWVRKILSELPEGENAVEFLEKKMLSTIPVKESDVVVIFSQVKGFDKNGCLRSLEKAFQIKPVKVGKVMLRAIQATTAAPMAECARMLLLGNRKGVILQSQIDPEVFMEGPFIRAVYHGFVPQKHVARNNMDAAA